MEVERRPTYALGKNFSCLKKNILRSLHISSILKMCLSSSFIMSLSLAQLPAAFSVLLAAITYFTLAFFRHNKHSQRVTFVGQNSVSGWENSSWLKINKRGGVGCKKNVLVCIFEKIVGGTPIPDWGVVIFEQLWI